jgi:hypothetical protein
MTPKKFVAKESRLGSCGEVIAVRRPSPDPIIRTALQLFFWRHFVQLIYSIQGINTSFFVNLQMNFFPVDRDTRNFGVEKWPEVLRNVDGLAGFSVCKDEFAFGPA